MTTANISVGIKTDSALASLKKLKEEMRRELGGMVIAVNEASLSASVQSALNKQKFRVNFDVGSLQRDVQDALNKAFASSTLKVKVEGGAAGAGGSAPEIKTLIQQILTPAVDELTKAATLIAGVARKTEVGQQAGAGRTSARSGFSYTDPNTGERLSFSRQLSDTAGTLSTIQGGNKTLKEQREAARAQAAQFAALNAANNLELAQIKREEGAAERNLARIQAERNRALNAANNLELAAIKREEREAEREVARLRKERERALNFANNLELSAVRAEERQAELLAARQRRERNAALNAANNLELAQIRREEQEADRAAARAKREAAQAQRLEMARFYESAKIEAAKSFRGTGVGISAASATAGRFGTAATVDFLGAKSGLLDQVTDLDRYRIKVKEVTEAVPKATSAHRELAATMRDVHSGARGLAGSLGMLWVTWGSTLPIVAAAALGGAMRSVFTIGKDLEYQLRFVQVLAGGATISMEQFGAAVRGSMTTPVEAAQALRGLAQNGLSAADALKALPDILNLATAGEMGLMEAALGATGVMAAFNLQVSDLGRVGDVFAKAAALSNTNVQGMVEAMKQASTVSDQYGVSLEETAASLAVMAKRNISGSAAGTAFRNMMVELATPTAHARKAMEALGLSVFDSEKKLKPFAEMLEEVRSKTIGLNEQSRLGFLNEIFGERGGKAVNAILSDFRLYQDTLRQVREESDGFAAGVTRALGETTQGKLKGLVSEFQLSMATSFGSANDSINYFIDRLRGVFASSEFKDGISTLVSNVARFTTLVMENATAIGYLLAAYASFKVASAIVSASFAALSASATGASVAVGGLTISMRALLGGATLGLGILIPLVAEWLLFSKNVDKASEAQKAFNENLARQSEKLDESIKRLARDNQLLAERVRLQLQGVEATEAQKRAEAKFGAKDTVDAKAQLDAKRAELRTAEVNLERLQAQSMRGARAGVMFVDPDQLATARERVQNLRTSVKDLGEVYGKFRAESDAKVQNTQQNDLLDRLAKIEAFKRKVDELKSKNPKLDTSSLGFDESEVLALDKKGFDAAMKRKDEMLNARLENKPLPSNETDKLNKSRISSIEAEIRREEEAIRRRQRLRAEEQRAQFDPKLYGAEVGALLAEQQARTGLEEALQLEVSAIKRLNDAKGLATGKSRASEIEQINDQIRAREANKKAIEEELQSKARAARFNADNRKTVEDEKERKSLAAYAAEVDGLIERNEKKYLLKVIDPVDAARADATLQATLLYAKDIAKIEEDLATDRSVNRQLLVDAMLLTGKEADLAWERYAANSADLAVQEKRLEIRRQMQEGAGAKAGGRAAEQEAVSRTAGYGWDKFWAEYRSNGESNAKAVYDIMKTTTDGMSNMMANFATTGKLKFREFAASVAAEATKMLMNRAILQFMTFAISAWGGSGGMSTNNTGTSLPTAGGRAKGGSVNSGKMYEVVEEGPELLSMGNRNYLMMGKESGYVTPASGWTGGGTSSGGGGGGTVNATVNVTVIKDGSTAAKSNNDDTKAGQLAKMLETGVMEVIVREKRPGGLLENA